jgi:hypothetical protein
MLGIDRIKQIAEARGGVEEAWRAFLAEGVKHWKTPFEESYDGTTVKGILRFDSAHVTIAERLGAVTVILPLFFEGNIQHSATDVLTDEETLSAIFYDYRKDPLKSYEDLPALETYYTLFMRNIPKNLRYHFQSKWYPANPPVPQHGKWMVGEVCLNIEHFINNNSYPSVKEALIPSLLEARGGVEEAWKTYIQNAVRSWSLNNYRERIGRSVVQGEITIGDVVSTRKDQSGDVWLHIPLSFSGTGKVGKDDAGFFDSIGDILETIFSEYPFHVCSSLLSLPQLKILEKLVKESPDFFFAIQWRDNVRELPTGEGEYNYRLGDLIINIAFLIEQNTFPPTMKEGVEEVPPPSLPLDEARGGTAEAWRTYIAEGIRRWEANYQETYDNLESSVKGKVRCDATHVTLEETLGDMTIVLPVLFEGDIQHGYTDSLSDEELLSAVFYTIHDKNFYKSFDDIPVIKTFRKYYVENLPKNKKHYHFQSKWFPEVPAPPKNGVWKVGELRLNISSLITANVFPPTVNESSETLEGVLAEPEALMEARGDIHTAWETYIRGIFQSFSCKDFIVTHNEKGQEINVPFEVKFIDAEVIGDAVRVGLQTVTELPQGVEAAQAFFIVREVKRRLAVNKAYYTTIRAIDGLLQAQYARGFQYDERIVNGECVITIVYALKYAILNNIYPPANEASLLAGTLPALTEARGGVKEAWEAYIREICESFSYKASVTILTERGKEITVPFEVKFLDTLIAGGRVLVGLGSITAFPPTLTREERDEVTQKVRLFMRNDSDFYKRIMLSVHTPVTFYGGHVRGYGTARNGDECEATITFSLADSFAKNIYPPAEIQESTSLLEARGGIVEAWEQYLHKALDNFHIACKFPEINLLVGNGTLSYMPEEGVQIVDSLATITLRWKGIVWDKSANEKAEYIRSLGYLQKIAGRPILHNVLAMFKDFMKDVSQDAETLSPAISIHAGSKSDTVIVIVSLSLSSILEQNIYPPDTVKKIGEEIALEDATQYLLQEAKGGVKEAWKDVLYKRFYTHSFLYTKDLQNRINQASGVFLFREIIEEGEKLYIVFQSTPKILGTTAFRTRVLHELGRWLERDSYFYPRIMNLSQDLRPALTFNRKEYALEGETVILMVEVSLSFAISMNTYPPKMSEDLVIEETPLLEARGGWSKHGATLSYKPFAIRR